MNCSKHPNEPAVAQCVDCGWRMCLQCAGIQNPPLCEDCREKHQSEDFGRSVLYVIGYTVLFFIGYNPTLWAPRLSRWTLAERLFSHGDGIGLAVSQCCYRFPTDIGFFCRLGHISPAQTICFCDCRYCYCSYYHYMEHH